MDTRLDQRIKVEFLARMKIVRRKTCEDDLDRFGWELACVEISRIINYEESSQLKSSFFEQMR